MPFHFCADEMIMIMAMIPFIGAFFKKVHLWYHVKFHHHCHIDSKCDKNHVDHKKDLND